MYLKEIQGMCCPLCCGVCYMVTQPFCGALASFLYLLNNVGLRAVDVVPVVNGYTWHQHCSSQGGTASQA